MSDYQHLKEEAFQANIELPGPEHVLFSFGNLSAADRKKGVFAVTTDDLPTEERTAEKILAYKITMPALQINPAAPRLKESLIQKHFKRKHRVCAFITVKTKF